LQPCRFEFLAQDTAPRHLLLLFYSFHNGFLGGIKSRLIHQHQRITQILCGHNPADKPESRKSIRVLKNRNPIRRDRYEKERLETRRSR
jgi:hypothetical protein